MEADGRLRNHLHPNEAVGRLARLVGDPDSVPFLLACLAVTTAGLLSAVLS